MCRNACIWVKTRKTLKSECDVQHDSYGTSKGSRRQVFSAFICANHKIYGDWFLHRSRTIEEIAEIKTRYNNDGFQFFLGLQGGGHDYTGLGQSKA